MDRRLVAVLILVTVASAGMGAAYLARTQPQSSGKLVVVASFYPLAYMAQTIGGDNIEVTTLIQPGIEPHRHERVDLAVAGRSALAVAIAGDGTEDWTRLAGASAEWRKLSAEQLEDLLYVSGVTGLAQINGRSNLDFEDEVKLDVYYIENWSLWLDIKIILKSIAVIFRADGD